MVFSKIKNKLIIEPWNDTETLVSSYIYATLKPWYSYLQSFIMLRLMVAYEGLI